MNIRRHIPKSITPNHNCVVYSSKSQRIIRPSSIESRLNQSYSAKLNNQRAYAQKMQQRGIPIKTNSPVNSRQLEAQIQSYQRNNVPMNGKRVSSNEIRMPSNPSKYQTPIEYLSSTRSNTSIFEEDRVDRYFLERTLEKEIKKLESNNSNPTIVKRSRSLFGRLKEKAINAYQKVMDTKVEQEMDYEMNSSLLYA